ncbi:hypothetical protein ACE3NQ_26240 [Paenibacillus terreus]|uniref:Uncharacterized protein n=1 Tax=Paenibacillus terreus TaxID=1387834 RepID=A0ABV5BG80_9BACL
MEEGDSPRSESSIQSESDTYRGWCMVYGVWCMVYGVWCMVYGVWCVVSIA